MTLTNSQYLDRELRHCPYCTFCSNIKTAITKHIRSAHKVKPRALQIRKNELGGTWFATLPGHEGRRVYGETREEVARMLKTVRFDAVPEQQSF